MRIALCNNSRWLGSRRVDYGCSSLSDALLEGLASTGVEVVHLDCPPEDQVDAEWWLVLDYLVVVPTWVDAFKRVAATGARIAYIESIAAPDVDVSVVWSGRQYRSPMVSLPMASLLPGAMRFRRGLGHDGVFVDHEWPDFRGTWQDRTGDVLDAIGSLQVRKTVQLPGDRSTYGRSGVTEVGRMSRSEFIALLAGHSKVIMTHREDYSMVVHEALYLGLEVLVIAGHHHQSIESFAGVTVVDDVGDLPRLLANPVSDSDRARWSAQFRSIEETSTDIVNALESWPR